MSDPSAELANFFKQLEISFATTIDAEQQQLARTAAEDYLASLELKSEEYACKVASLPYLPAESYMQQASQVYDSVLLHRSLLRYVSNVREKPGTNPEDPYSYRATDITNTWEDKCQSTLKILEGKHAFSTWTLALLKS
jgi:hypothetical protein